MEDGQIRRPDTGTAQSGVISPVICNVYLHRLDQGSPSLRIEVFRR
jgi:RNA-directed DNA polymerase